jgi:hypothetical protein
MKRIKKLKVINNKLLNKAISLQNLKLIINKFKLELKEEEKEINQGEDKIVLMKMIILLII